MNALHHIVCSVDFVSGKLAALFETSIYISLLQGEMNNISTELCKLKLEVRTNKVGTEDWFNSEEKVNFYTGLPNSYVLVTVFEFVSSGMK